jgi:peptidyl-prolyl cis-trans isomerase B (cyclophilin B)
MARNSRTKATHSIGNNRSEHHISPESSPHNRAGPTRSIAHAPTVRSQAHETLGTMTTIIMRTSEGDITINLFDDQTPVTVKNFLGLATGEKEWTDPFTGQPSHEPFYNGLTFHRIISGFMIQGGDPLGTGMGGSEREIKGEFDSNGVKNPLSHTRGAISMARAQRKDSASSQFFIVHEDSTFLDGEYACFGYVTDGMDVVDAICEDTKVEDNNGTVAKENQPVIESIKVID